MVRYLKWIVIIFGSIGLLIGSFFYLQNKEDIHVAWSYKDKIDYLYLREKCEQNYVFPCLKPLMNEYFQKVSMTGIGFGMKMAFTVMDQDNDNTDFFKSEQEKNMRFSLNYLVLNNMAMNRVYQNYHGFQKLYGGYLASLEQFYGKAHRFSEDIITGLQGPEGISLIQDKKIKSDYLNELEALKKDYYSIKKNSEKFNNEEMSKLLSEEK